MLPHSGVRTSSWRKLFRWVTSYRSSLRLLGSRVEPSVAILFSWENWWALELTSKPADIELLDQVLAYYRPLWAAGLVADSVPPGRTCPDERWFACRTYILSTIQQRQRLFGTFGRAVWLSYHSSAASSTLTNVSGGPYPAPWTELLGADVLDFYPYSEGERGLLRTSTDEVFACDLWSEAIEVHGAEVVATYDQGRLTGEPAILRHEYGMGAIFYIGTRLDEKGMAWLLSRALTHAGHGAA